MANSWFQFKQFKVQQDKTAMKVCTDACLFGAWVAEEIKSINSNIQNILDIGSGTGLLSLMLAQKANATIDAVEIDGSAAAQTQENFNASVWNERFKVIEGDIRTLRLTTHYDLIISNPPFFENDLKSKDQKRNHALHSEALNFEELVSKAATLLKAKGRFFVLLPYHRNHLFINLAERNSLFLHQQVLVKQTEKHSYFRSMLSFSRSIQQAKKSEIVIKKGGNYSEEFKALLRDYYLYML